MSFELQILGSGSAVPTLRRFPTSQVLNIQNNYFLIDCGEGAQMQMRRFGVKMQKIDCIFISHLHGDHYLGLSGYLQTLHLLGRKKKLQIFGPKALEDIILNQFKAIDASLRFPVVFIPTNPSGKNLLLNKKNFSIYSFPLSHKIPTTGFLFEEKEKPRAYNKPIGDSYNIPYYWINRIKNGADYKTESGELVKNEKLTFPPSPSFSYAFCSDTAFIKDLHQHIKGVDLMYHEASFLEKDKQRATETMHSTAADAGKQAQLCEAKQLIMGHFSARYSSFDAFIKQAAEHFTGQITLAEDGLTVDLAL